MIPSIAGLHRVLVVEDDRADQFIALRVLRRAWPGVRIVTASDGQEALETIERGDPGAAPELILLDINMPRMNGHEFLDRFCGDARLVSPSVAMLTSSDHPVDRARTEAFACVRDYLVKPLTVGALHRLAATLERR